MMTDTERIAAQREQLHHWSIEAAVDFKRTFGVAPGRWLQMEAESGTEGAIKRILSPDWPEANWVTVLTQLWESRRLHWSAEAAALRFPLLFELEQRGEAQKRLERFGYQMGTDLPED